MHTLKLRYSRPVAVLFLVAGALLLVTSLLSERTVTIFSGGVLILGGILMLINPTVVIEPGEVQMRNMLGMTLKRYPLRSPQDLRADEKGLRHVPTGKKIVSLGMSVDKSDAAELRRRFSGHAQQGPAYGAPPQQGGLPYGVPPQDARPGYPQQG